jgi:glycosyltransferase involved in cell wall biosynthesis
MKLCFVGHQSTMEGAGRFMLDQVDYFQQHGVAVYIVLPTVGPLLDAIVQRGVPVRVVANPWWTKASTHGAEPDYAATLLAAHEIAAAFREWSIDVVYTQTVVAPAGPIAAALAGLPHVWHIHEFSHNPGAIEMAVPKPLLARLIAGTSNAVFFTSNAVASEWTAWIGHDKRLIVYNWASATADDEPPDTNDAVALELLGDERVFVIAIVGSLVRWKRQMDAVDATADLLSRGFNVALLIVGPAPDPSYLAEIRHAVARRQLSERVRILGYTEFPKRIMRAANVMVVCSDQEPFGRVTVEAMAHGTPVVATNSGGTPEIIDDGVDGMLFPTGDVAALAAKLATLIEDSNLLARLSAAATEKSKRFQSAESEMGPVMQHLRLLVGEHNPSWPLGTLVDAGLDGAIPNTTPTAYVRYRRRAGRLLRAVLKRRTG